MDDVEAYAERMRARRCRPSQPPGWAVALGRGWMELVTKGPDLPRPVMSSDGVLTWWGRGEEIVGLVGDSEEWLVVGVERDGRRTILASGAAEEVWPVIVERVQGIS